MSHVAHVTDYSIGMQKGIVDAITSRNKVLPGTYFVQTFPCEEGEGFRHTRSPKYVLRYWVRNTGTEQHWYSNSYKTFCTVCKTCVQLWLYLANLFHNIMWLGVCSWLQNNPILDKLGYTIFPARCTGFVTNWIPAINFIIAIQVIQLEILNTRTLCLIVASILCIFVLMLSLFSKERSSQNPI